jgi:DNA-binding transcriptional LysR family regulator
MTKILDWHQYIGRRLRLRDLHVFVAVAQAGSMAKAAVQLRVSQPAVSQVVADLEHVLRVKLLDRSSRGVELTTYGHALLDGTVAAFDGLKQTVKSIEFLADATAGEVRIGCPETVAALLPPVVRRLSERHPSVVVHVSDLVAPTLEVPLLRDRTLDLALVRVVGSPSNYVVADDLNVEVLFNDETLVVVGLKNALARRRKVTLHDLVEASWILPPPNSLNSQIVIEAFRAAGLSAPKIRLVTFSVQLRLNLLTDGSYVSVLPRSLTRLYRDQLPVKVVPITLPARQWPVALVTVKNRTLNPVAQVFINHVRECFGQLEPSSTARNPQQW